MKEEKVKEYFDILMELKDLHIPVELFYKIKPNQGQNGYPNIENLETLVKCFEMIILDKKEELELGKVKKHTGENQEFYNMISHYNETQLYSLALKINELRERLERIRD